MKQLPINTEPYMRAYTQYAYIDMILNNSVRTGEELTKLELSEPLDTDWIFDFKDAEVSIKDSSISVKQNWQVKSDVKFFYRKMKKKEEIVLRITDLEYTNEWDSLGFFIDDSLDNFAEYPKMIYTLGSYCGPYVHQLYKDRNKLVVAKHDMKEYPFYLKISIEKNVLKDFISYDGTVWEQIDCIENFADVEKEHYIGVYLCLLDRQYYKWVYNNFIQLSLDLDNQTALNYAGFIRRDSKNYLMNPFLRISNEKASVIQSYGLDMWTFIKANIDNGRYIELYLNEKYIPGAETYQQEDKVHENLVYGYDDGNREVLLITIYEGKPRKLNVTAECFQRAYAEAKEPIAQRMYMFEFKPNNNPYEIDLRGIIRQMREYVAGTDSSLYYKNLMSSEPGVYGISIYDAILENEDSKRRFATDYRLAYVLMEHKQCMRDRIGFFLITGYLKEEECTEIVETLDEICSATRRILSVMLKHMVRRHYEKCDSVWNLLEDIRNKEKVLYVEIADLLEKYVQQQGH